MELQGIKVAILVANGFEESEMLEPRKALTDHGAQTFIISPEKSQVKSWIHDNWSNKFPIDSHLQDADPNLFDALVLPGGVMNPDKLRMNETAVNFVKHFVDKDKPIAAICHGPWTLIDAGGVKGHQVTSWKSLKSDLINAGAEWVDEVVVLDKKLVTSRKPDDLPAFNKTMIELFSKCHKK
jgi:protease I